MSLPDFWSEVLMLQKTPRHCSDFFTGGSWLSRVDETMQLGPTWHLLHKATPSRTGNVADLIIYRNKHRANKETNIFQMNEQDKTSGGKKTNGEKQCSR